MKERHVEFSYLVNGHVIQDIILTDDNVSPDELIKLLNNGSATTSVVEGQHVIIWADIANPRVVGIVNSTEPELEYEEFDIIQVTEFPEQPPQTFNATRMALAAAIGEYIDEPDMTTIDIVRLLEHAGNEIPALNVVEHMDTWTGYRILKEINLTVTGLRGLMEIAYNAAKLNQELV